ncbi:hypothetical protein [Streptomyces gobiensis]|uniref:hypothetical protein n=1 Tax=Streptomyces gobiensis TaxID=2875706 RepID=UPI001E5713F8|nr:hypothetical protein [Streptomyces gobiensis]UGY91365.1 hypothetical protein test1122_06270 [Streptomyces gobiensis]
MGPYIRSAFAAAGLTATGLAASFALGLLATGCAGVQGSPEATRTGSVTEPREPRGKPTGLDEERLRLGLLDLNDLPSGWATDSERAARKRGIGVPQPAEGSCRALFQSATDSAGTSAEARFARSRTGPFITTGAGAYTNDRTARSALAAFRKAAGECAKFQITEGPGEDAEPVTYEARKLAMPRLGDESVAVRFAREGSGDEQLTVIADVVYARVGASAVHLAHAGREDSGDDSADGADSVTPMARRAVHKLRDVTARRTPRPTASFPGVTKLKSDPYARSYE